MSIGDKPSDPFSFDLRKREVEGGGSKKLHLHLEDDKVTPIYVKTLDKEKFLQEKSSFDHTESLSLSRKWVPVTLKDAKGEDIDMLINIQSAAEHLGVTKEDVYKAAKEGKFKQLLLLGQHLGGHEIRKIDEYIRNNRIRHQEEAKNSGKAVYIRASESGFARGLQFNADGTIYIHFNKKVQDPQIGQGLYKRVRLAMNYDTKEICAVARLHGHVEGDVQAQKDIQREFNFLQRFKDRTGIAQAIECIKVDGKRAKTLFIQPLYTEGDLFGLIHETRSLSEKDKLKVALDLLKGGAALQEEKIIHRDLKSGNIFASRDKEGVINAYIADFGFAFEEEEEANMKAEMCGTPPYYSPEYNDVRDLRELEAATTYKHDAWALGCIIFEIHRGMLLRGDSRDYYPELSAPTVSLEEDPLAWLEYDLLRTDRNERLSAEEALRKYGPLLEEKLE